MLKKRTQKSFLTLKKVSSPSKEDWYEGDECGEHPGGRDHGECGAGVHVVVVVERLHDGKVPVPGVMVIRVGLLDLSKNCPTNKD